LIDPALSARWTKSRRSDLCFSLLSKMEKELSDLVTLEVDIWDERAVQDAYERLDRGEEIAVRINYER